MDRKIPLIPEYIEPINFLFIKPKNEDTVTHVAWDKV